MTTKKKTAKTKATGDAGDARVRYLASLMRAMREYRCVQLVDKGATITLDATQWAFESGGPPPPDETPEQRRARQKAEEDRILFASSGG